MCLSISHSAHKGVERSPVTIRRGALNCKPVDNNHLFRKKEIDEMVMDFINNGAQVDEDDSDRENGTAEDASDESDFEPVGLITKDCEHSALCVLQRIKHCG